MFPLTQYSYADLDVVVGGGGIGTTYTITISTITLNARSIETNTPRAMYLACLSCLKFFHDWPELKKHFFTGFRDIEMYGSTECYVRHESLRQEIYKASKEDERERPYTDFDYGDDRLEAILTRVHHQQK